MTSLDSSSQASDSRPSTPPPTITKESTTNASQQKQISDEVDSVKLNKFKTEKQ